MGIKDRFRLSYKYMTDNVFSLIAYNKSYSQSAEDLIVRYFLRHVMNHSGNINYLDIGANHPTKLSNTFLFYKENTPNGGGVLIEPDDFMCKRLRNIRPNDTVLNVGVASNELEEEIDFYVFNHSALSTCSKSEKDHYLNLGYSLIDVKTVKTVNINSLIQNHFESSGLDILSIDVEGLDFQILNSLHLELVRPKVIIVETIRHDSRKQLKKNDQIEVLLRNVDYSVYADTFINTIFIDNKYWKA